ncbi:MAG: preprotein translocase subunit SecE [Actinomycetota bacterium]|nr:preprotein translocase subunit SecE [Actinomycetota bacterium]
MTETRDATATPERGSGAPERRSLPSRISLYYRQVIAELRKVIWPTRKELLTYTSVVIVFVLIIVAFVSALDFAFGQLVLRVFG